MLVGDDLIWNNATLFNRLYKKRFSAFYIAFLVPQHAYNLARLRQEYAELLYSVCHFLPGHVETTFGQQLTDVGGGQAVAEIPAHGHHDHVTRLAVMGKGCAGAVGEATLAGHWQAEQRYRCFPAQSCPS